LEARASTDWEARGARAWQNECGARGSSHLRALGAGDEGLAHVALSEQRRRLDVIPVLLQKGVHPATPPAQDQPCDPEAAHGRDPRAVACVRGRPRGPRRVGYGGHRSPLRHGSVRPVPPPEAKTQPASASIPALQLAASRWHRCHLSTALGFALASASKPWSGSAGCGEIVRAKRERTPSSCHRACPWRACSCCTHSPPSPLSVPAPPPRSLVAVWVSARRV
jgi:hypothetical protein